jgi:pimeloyl-ACP methyl ester carboxylesterase
LLTLGRHCGVTLALLWLSSSACTPVVRGGPFHAAPTYTVARARSPDRAAYRVFPPPSGCAPVAPPIVFLPALGLTQESFRELLPRLRACRARVLVDLPGIGESSSLRAIDEARVRQAIADVVATEGAGAPVVLVGNSIGAMLSIYEAAEHPDHVAALVLIDGSLVPFPLVTWQKFALHPHLWGPLQRLVGPALGVRLTLPILVTPGWTPDPRTVGLLSWVLADSQQRTTMLHYYRVFIDEIPWARKREALERVRAPTLVVWGQRDPVNPVASVAPTLELLKAHTRVSARILPTGHLPPLEAPDEVARAIDELLETLPETPATPVDPHARAVVPNAPGPGTLLYGKRREWFPLIGASALFSTDGRTDLAALAGVARGSIDHRYPLEAGRLVWTVGAAWRSPSAPGSAGSFGYLQSTLRLEAVWRWAGGVHLDGTLLVDPVPERTGRVGGWGALGYTPSVLPWVRGFVAYGVLPGGAGQALFGIELDARLTGLLY